VIQLEGLGEHRKSARVGRLLDHFLGWCAGEKEDGDIRKQRISLDRLEGLRAALR
jgi:hypothetical protein